MGISIYSQTGGKPQQKTPYKQPWQIVGRCATYGTMIRSTGTRGQLARPQSFMPTAFTESLHRVRYQHESVKLDVMHDDRFTVADTRDGSLVFEPRADGLDLYAWMEQTGHASERAILEILRGTMRGLSVQGYMIREPREHFDAIVTCELLSVSIVDSGACPGTWLRLFSPDEQRAEKLRDYFLHYGDLG